MTQKIMNRALINCANLHVGGGVQVAASLVSELLGDDVEARCSIVISSAIAHSGRLIFDADEPSDHIRVLNTYGMRSQSRALWRFMDRHDSVFTVFGPLYRWWTPFRNITGFAQAWIIYPSNECYARLPLLRRLLTRLKFAIQAMYFKRADELVVELEHVKQGLVRELGIPAERIHVVHNCLSSIYLDAASWKPVDLPPADCDLRLGFVGRNYLHKNTEIFPAIAHALKTIHGLDARFYVTFTDAEWQACTPEFRDVCINVGPLTVAQCPSFYRALDAVVFPSLLECFSATPLEAMAMEKPLIASDRPFNRDVCGAHAHYFDPAAPETAADQIAKLFDGAKPDANALQLAREHAINFSSPKERARRYLEILQA